MTAVILAMELKEMWKNTHINKYLYIYEFIGCYRVVLFTMGNNWKQETQVTCLIFAFKLRSQCQIQEHNECEYKQFYWWCLLLRNMLNTIYGWHTSSDFLIWDITLQASFCRKGGLASVYPVLLSEGCSQSPYPEPGWCPISPPAKK